MSSLLIEGGRPISGTIEVEGNKNAALPLLAACLLTTEECVLTNMPRIGDVEVMAKLLTEVGAEVRGHRHDDHPRALQEHQDARSRAASWSASFAGRCCCWARCWRGRAARFSACRAAIFPRGARSARTSTRWCNLGATVLPSTGHALEAPDGLHAGVDVSRRSVGHRNGNGAARGGDDRRRHGNPPRGDRAARRRGVRVSAEHGRRHHRRRLVDDSRSRARAQPRGATHRLNGDYIEAGSWAVVAAVTGGEIEVRGARAEDVEGIAFVLKRMKVACTFEDGLMTIQKSKPVAAGRITTGLWPSFPSDFVSLVTVLATQADGRTLIHDWMYELRLFALEQLSGMRADLFLCDPHRIIVTGPSKLKGRKLDSRDLRSGMALIAAGLAAEGQSRLSPLETVERGYGQLVERLKMLGAQVEQVEQRMSPPQV